MTKKEKAPASGQLALVTGASTGIGLELARCCAAAGFDLLIASDDGKIEEAADELRQCGVTVDAVHVDLSTEQGVTELYQVLNGRVPELLLANAGHGLGHGFLDQDFQEVRHVIDTNITRTVDLIQRVGKDMRLRRSGRMLITGSIAG